MSLLVRDARLVDASGDERGWLLVEGDRIAAFGSGETGRSHERADLTLDAGGRVLMPAFVDLHAHLRDPGYPEKESLESGCLAAAAGGFGTLVAMANTRPPTSDPALALATRARALALGLVDYLPALTMTRDLEGRDHEHLDGLEALLAGPAGLGLRLLSDDGKDVADEELFLSVLRRAAGLDLLASCHCELPGPGGDRGAEIRGVERAIRLGREAGSRLHIAHVSTRESVDLVRRAKSKALGQFRLTCEATPHHLALTSALARALGEAGEGRVNPPLAEEEDRLALVEGLVDGTIDAIATDHAPHAAADKAAGAPGYSGLETAFSLVYETLSRDGRLGLRDLSRLMSAAPARILGLEDRGLLEVGMRADLVLVNTGATLAVEPSTWKSRGKNSPIAGRRLPGAVLITLHGGRIVHDAR